MNPYNLDSVHEAIKTIYEWWSVQAPGVRPVEGNELGSLWAIADRLYEEERNG